MKIYTKSGDDGSTGLFGGGRIPKADLRMDAIGDVDELNSSLGMCRLEASGSFAEELEAIQSQLFDLGAELATPGGKRHVVGLTADQADSLERSIDRLEEELAPLRNFILPGGSSLSAKLHHARSVCRRAERSVLKLHDREVVRSEARVFLNRLSDWLFVAARTANARAGVEDIVWKKSE